MNIALAIGCFLAALLLASTAWHLLNNVWDDFASTWLAVVRDVFIFAGGLCGPTALAMLGIWLLGGLS